MRKIFPSAFIFVALAAVSVPAANAADLPAPKILVVNRAAILQASKVGQDIARQVQAYAAQAKADMDKRQKALQAEGQALQQQIAILAPDAKQKKIQAFEAKENELQANAQRRQQMIQGGLINAQQTIEQTLGPILNDLMKERGANLIVDKSLVVYANSSVFDITEPAIERLNQKLPSLKVTLAEPATPAKPK
jgi:outer membrane protein